MTAFKPVLAMTVLLAACSGGGEEANHVVSSGLKIFVTAEAHSGNFAQDPSLSGANAMQKADDFCNQSISKPDGASYKAFLIDGTNRDAVSLKDWVFKPNTTYYQAYDNVVIDTTTGAAIFNVAFTLMQNSVLGCGGCSGPSVWSGVGDATNFSASSNNCGGWGAGSMTGTMGTFAQSTERNHFAFSSGGSTAACDINSGGNQLNLYCVQQ